MTLLRSSQTRIQPQLAILPRYQGTSRTTEVTPLFPPHLRGTPVSLLALRGPPIPSAKWCSTRSSSEGDATKELSYQATDTARYTSLIPGHLLHRGGLRRCSLHSRTGKASSFLQKGDATQELSYQATDAARSTTSRTEKPTRLSRKETLQRSSHTRIETSIPLLLLALRSPPDSPARSRYEGALRPGQRRESLNDFSH